MVDEETPDNASTQPEPVAAPATGSGGQRAQFAIQKLYFKDVSFESPGAPTIFQDTGQHELKLNLSQQVKAVGEAVYEVVLTVTVTCKLGDKTAYLAEVQQAGLFILKDFEDAQLQATLGAYCPNILFPYARQQISEMVLHGGFQPLLLQPVNFDQLYAEQMRRQQAEQPATESKS